MNWVGRLLAVAVVVGACGGTASTEPAVEGLEVDVFDTLESLVLDAPSVTAILAGEQPGPGYNSNPPTSGSHAGEHARCGVYRQEIPDIYQVASLARGAVLVQYQPTLGADDRARIETLARSRSGVVAAPRRDLPSVVVATAWGSMLTMSSVDESLIDGFITQQGRQGPDNASCPVEVDES